jgi:hypothetical protein
MSVQTEEGELHTTWGDAKDVNVVHYHQDWLHEHGYATAALCEALATHRSEVLRSAANRAVQVILRAQNPYSGWRYSVPGNGDADSAMTGEMVVALRAAQEVEIGGDLRELFTNGLVFLDNLTDPASGRVGYTDMGGLSSRIRELTAQFPAEHTEAMTALALFAGVLAGRAPEASLLSKQEHLLAAKPPRWDPSLGCIDFYYWYYGTYALHQVGRASWSPWEEALVSALLPAQRKDADTKGSWDPVDAWGTQGGRVYSTALAAMCLEVDTRFAQALPPTAEKSKRAQQPK